MKPLISSRPLCYMLSDSQMVSALPYIDEQRQEYKNKIQYLIKQSQQHIQFDQVKYLSQLSLPITPFASSEDFQKEVDRIKAKRSINKEEKKDKKLGNQHLDQINASMFYSSKKLSKEDEQKVRKLIIGYENNLLKEINLQIYEKLGPQVQKQLILALDKKKKLLQKQIQKQKLNVQQINKKRQYQQFQNREREQTVKDRLKVMIHKRKKIQ